MLVICGQINWIRIYTVADMALVMNQSRMNLQLRRESKGEHNPARWVVLNLGQWMSFVGQRVEICQSSGEHMIHLFKLSVMVIAKRKPAHPTYNQFPD
jgi:hypothetical protein